MIRCPTQGFPDKTATTQGAPERRDTGGIPRTWAPQAPGRRPATPARCGGPSASPALRGGSELHIGAAAARRDVQRRSGQLPLNKGALACLEVCGPVGGCAAAPLDRCDRVEAEHRSEDRRRGPLRAAAEMRAERPWRVPQRGCQHPSRIGEVTAGSGWQVKAASTVPGHARVWAGGPAADREQQWDVESVDPGCGGS